MKSYTYFIILILSFLIISPIGFTNEPLEDQQVPVESKLLQPEVVLPVEGSQTDLISSFNTPCGQKSLEQQPPIVPAKTTPDNRTNTQETEDEDSGTTSSFGTRG